MRVPARALRLFALPATVALLVAAAASPAAADHTNPADRMDLPVLAGAPVAVGGQWTFIANMGAHQGSDLEVFRRGKKVYATSGTFGQGDIGYIGQRIVQLIGDDGKVAPTWIADHGSAWCRGTNVFGSTGLQHDNQATPQSDPELLLDATDAASRCHDPRGGGVEIVDISGVGRDGGAPVREIHLTRHDGTSHNVTVDATRPWIVYNSNTDEGRPWIDVLDIRTCLGLGSASLEAKRAACRPVVYRIPFDDSWTSALRPDGTLEGPHGCHDITAKPGRIYCAAIFGTAVFDVTNLTDAAGNVRGTPLPCKVIEGTNTEALVTDCDLGTTGGSPQSDADEYDKLGRPAAEGWSLVSHMNHPGTNADGNNQTEVPADEGVSISHEADPTPDGRYLFVTDERGGGLVPPGASCAPGPGNPIGNGGMHVYDLADPANPQYAKTPDGKKAIFISNNVLPEPTFCNIHVIEQVPDEGRVFMAWYSQGIKVVDYKIDANGAWTFEEVGWITLPGAQTWAAEVFHIVNNPDGTRTYYVMASDIARGIDVMSFTAKPHLLPKLQAAGGGGGGGGGGSGGSAGSSGTLGSVAAGGAGGTGDTLPASGESMPVLLPLSLLPLALVARRLALRSRRAG